MPSPRPRSTALLKKCGNIIVLTTIRQSERQYKVSILKPELKVFLNPRLLKVRAKSKKSGCPLKILIRNVNHGKTYNRHSLVYRARKRSEWPDPFIKT